MGKYDFVEAELERRKSLHLLRELRPLVPISAAEVSLEGRVMLNFCSNDYMGLSKHPLLGERAARFAEKYGYGSTASRLVCGTLACFEEVEEKLAALKGTERALIFNSGFQANISILPTLADRGTLILSDWLNHNSIIQGSLLARCDKARFRHNDLAHLRRLLEEAREKKRSRILIVTESVFSMDGDRSDIGKLVELAEEFQAILVVDEAHATGVLGEQGMGLTCGKNVDVTMGTFGKAAGSFGSYIACSEKLRDYFVNCCGGFIYTTALPPPLIGAIDAALDLIPTMGEERRELHRKADFVRASLNRLGWSTLDSTTQIIPVLIGSEKETLELSKWLEHEGIFASAIRPPTVEKGRSRIRLTLSAAHTQAHVEKLVGSFEKWRKMNS